MTPHGTQIALAEAPLGLRMRIRHMKMKPEVGLRLRELGLSEDAVVRCVKRGYGNLICQVLNTRIAIDLELAKRILVTHTE